MNHAASAAIVCLLASTSVALLHLQQFCICLTEVLAWRRKTQSSARPARWRSRRPQAAVTWCAAVAARTSAGNAISPSTVTSTFAMEDACCSTQQRSASGRCKWRASRKHSMIGIPCTWFYMGGRQIAEQTRGALELLGRYRLSVARSALTLAACQWV